MAAAPRKPRRSSGTSPSPSGPRTRKARPLCADRSSARAPFLSLIRFSRLLHVPRSGRPRQSSRLLCAHAQRCDRRTAGLDEAPDWLRDDLAFAEHRRPAHDRPHYVSAEGLAYEWAHLVAVEKVFRPPGGAWTDVPEGAIRV